MEAPKVVHYAPTQRRRDERDPMCGYAAPGDAVSGDVQLRTCQECLGWVAPEREEAPR